ncbi:MAG: metallophosphoesterase family protein [Candidatus Odinarchaeota archaeon]
MSEKYLAALSDIHGNTWALEAVLEDIRARRVQNVVNLGDSLYGPLDPTGTARMLIDNKITSVSGNEDRILVEEQENGEINRTLVGVKEQLTDEHLEWLQNLKGSIVHNGLFLCHGSPERDDEYLVEQVLEQGIILRNDEELVKKLVSVKQQVILCGHSHVPRMVYLSDRKLIINPGSVGLQAYTDDMPYPHGMETGSPHARYSIISESENGWHVEMLAVPYDWEVAATVAKKNARPDWARWLRTGRFR